MVKFGFKVLILTFIGWSLLVLFAPDLAPYLILFVIGILFSAALLKVILDVTLHFMQARSEEQALQKGQPGQSVRVYYDLDEFRRAADRQDRAKSAVPTNIR